MSVLGGYQKINLSTADLTASTLSVKGLSKSCGNANGKAALVKMPDGTEAFGAVKEVTGGFQLSAMGADSKVRQFNVDDTDDTFTMKTGEEVSDSEAVYGFGNAVDLKDYTVDTPYVVPGDGYVVIAYAATVASGNKTFVCAKKGLTGAFHTKLGQVVSTHGSDYDYTSVFVKKGMQVYPVLSTGTSTMSSVLFQKLEAL